MEAREVSRTTCPLRHQTGSQAIYNFDTIVAGMAPALRAAFERERAARAAELAQIIAWQECSRPESTRQRDAGASQAPKEAMMDDQIHSTTLGGVPLFRDLTPEEMIQVDARLRRMVAPAGATIVSAQQPGYAVYIVLEGVLKVTVDSADGGSTILSFLGAGEVIGEMSMVWGPTCSASVVATWRRSWHSGSSARMPRCCR